MNDKRDRACRSWEKLLTPDALKANLVRASVYLASYELLKTVVVENPRRFFNMGHSPIGEDSPAYKAEVIAQYPKDRFKASCLWFQKAEAIDGEDVATLEQIRAHRNEIAHELPKYLADSQFGVNTQLLDSIYFMASKIERWWIREVEMQVNSEFDDADKDVIPDSKIQGGTTIMLDLIHKIIHGQDQELSQLLDVLRTVWKEDPEGPSKSGATDRF